MYEVKVLADSISSANHRLTTFSVTFPRFILAEVNTHRMLSRNSASSRAIPLWKSISAVRDDPFIPDVFGKNQPGMSADEQLLDEAAIRAASTWKTICAQAVMAAEALVEIDVHKSIGNRILEPFKWHTAIVSGTDWSNFFALRTAKNAQPEFRTIAQMMQEQYVQSEPILIRESEWHLPLVSTDEVMDEALSYADPYIDWEMWKKISIGRCARVSYLTHEGHRNLSADIDLYSRLRGNGHLSPFEHVARPFKHDEWNFINYLQNAIDHYPGTWVDNMANYLANQIEYAGNFRGWWQARLDVPNQNDFAKVLDGED